MQQVIAHTKWVQSGAWVRQTLQLGPDAPYPHLSPAQSAMLEGVRNMELRGAYLMLWRTGGPLVVDHARNTIDTAGTDDPASRLSIAILHRHIPVHHVDRGVVSRALTWVQNEIPATQDEALADIHRETQFCYEFLMRDIGPFEADVTIDLVLAPNGVPEGAGVTITPPHPGLALLLEAVVMSVLFPPHGDTTTRRLRLNLSLRKQPRPTR